MAVDQTTSNREMGQINYFYALTPLLAVLFLPATGTNND